MQITTTQPPPVTSAPIHTHAHCSQEALQKTQVPAAGGAAPSTTGAPGAAAGAAAVTAAGGASTPPLHGEDQSGVLPGYVATGAAQQS